MDKRKIGLTMIALGVLVWVIYAAAKLAGIPLDFGIVLAMHLVFVIPGALLAPGENIYSRVTQWLRRDKSREELR